MSATCRPAPVWGANIPAAPNPRIQSNCRRLGALIAVAGVTGANLCGFGALPAPAPPDPPPDPEPPVPRNIKITILDYWGEPVTWNFGIASVPFGSDFVIGFGTGSTADAYLVPGNYDFQVVVTSGDTTHTCSVTIVDQPSGVTLFEGDLANLGTGSITVPNT
ncbi:MAG TPA: hypothetical protein VL357_01620 [Rariglobus sp.]|nr:hypothetical protein [Rariglobus sp.]